MAAADDDTDGERGREHPAAPARWSEPTVDVGARPHRGAPLPEHAATVLDSTADPARRSAFDTTAARFETRGELGRGGMGRVDDAYDRALERHVAIKHLLRGGDVDHARFEREARLTARLEHPGIVPVHDVGIAPDGTPYYVMRRVDGRPLVDVVAAATSYAERLALIPNVLAACDAVAFAHSHHVIHRDLKPANILVGRFGETLVIDWGLARELEPGAAKSATSIPVSDAGLTVAGTVAGTPGFMAPEQARGEPVDERADVFALGATLFYAIAGVSPFRGTSATELIGAAGKNLPPDWTTLPREVPPDLRAIVTKALASDASQRYADAGELASDLRRFVTGNLVDAHRYGTLARLARFVRRQRAVVAVAAASAVVLAAVAVYSFYRVVAERDDATDASARAETSRRQAVDVADEMLVDRARALATTDPVGAVLLLRRLAPESTRWRDAWLAAVAAWTRGVPYGFHADVAVVMEQIAADGDRMVTVGAGGSGRITVYDLAARTRRVVRELERAAACYWLGAQQLACVHHIDRLSLVDTTTGALRPVAVTVDWIAGDAASRVVVQTKDHRLVEIGPDGTLHELMRDVLAGNASPDLAAIVVQRGADLVEWTAAGVRTLGPVGRNAMAARGVAVARGDTVVTRIDDTIVRWRIRGDRAVEDGRWPADSAISLALVAGHIYATTPDGVRVVDLGATFLHPAVGYPMLGGLAVIQLDGSIAIVDDVGLFVLGPYPMQLVRVDVSRDHRFAVAAGYAGDVLVWDLAAQRPRSVRTRGIEVPLAASAHAIWSIVPGLGVARHAVPDTGSDGIVIPILATPMDTAAVGSEGAFAAIRSTATSELIAYDSARDLLTPIPHAVGFHRSTMRDGRDSLVVARDDGTLARWLPGAGVAALGALGATPRGLAVAEPFVVTSTSDRELIRIEMPGTRRGTATVRGKLADAAVARDGRAWIVDDGGALWRWDLDAEPVAVTTAEPIGAVFKLGDHVFASGAHTLTTLDTTPMRSIALDRAPVASLDDDYVATRSSTGKVLIVDTRSGTRIALADDTSSPALAATGSTVVVTREGVGNADRLVAVDLGAPHDAQALQRWVATVTNAVPAAGGEGVLWP